MSSSVVSKETATFFAYVAINQLLSKVNNTPKLSIADIAKAIDYAKYQEKIESPLFVTWNVLSVQKGTGAPIDSELRGCIGNFSNLKLPEYVEEYALVSALEDPRFPPIDKYELADIEKDPGQDLQCAVTVLHSFEDITNTPLEWTVGKHGIRLAFRYRSRSYSSTFLPEVAKEQGWDRSQTMDALIRKAGVSGHVSFGDTEKIQVVKVERYSGVKGEARLSDFSKISL